MVVKKEMDKLKARHELKYLVTSAQIAILKSRISSIVAPDPHVGATGKYNISSLYFDDYYNHCFYDGENGTDPREKFRIRIYNHSKERITLELKKKIRGKTIKESSPLTLEQTYQLMKKECITDIKNQSTLLQNLTLEMAQHLLRPVVIVEYDRYPFVYKNGNVRITFDTNVSSSAMIADFLDGKYLKRPVMPVGLHLLEVKFDEYLPDFIHSALQLENLQQTAYSKYNLCRKYNIKGE